MNERECIDLLGDFDAQDWMTAELLARITSVVITFMRRQQQQNQQTTDTA